MAITTSDWRQMLVGLEQNIFDLVAACTPEVWAEWLKTPLEIATARGDADLARKLAEAGSASGDALHAAVEIRHGEVVNILLENGASPNAVDSDGLTPLHVAAADGQEELVQVLLLKGADVHVLTRMGRNPLQAAATYGHVAATKLLLAAGAKVDNFDQDYKTAMHLAAKGGHAPVLAAIIRHGVDMDIAGPDYVDIAGPDDITPLHLAARHNKAAAAEVLLRAGANIHAKEVEVGDTPLHTAALMGSREALVVLLKHGEGVNTLNGAHQTPLHLAACRAGAEGGADAVDMLLRFGADETLRDIDGEFATDAIGMGKREDDTPVVDGDIERVRMLLANAPADRAWRRRGYLVLCRSHPDRLQLRQEGRESSTSGVGTTRSTRSSVKRGRTNVSDSTLQSRRSKGAGAVNTSININADDHWAGMATRLVDVGDEDIFRTIISFL